MVEKDPGITTVTDANFSEFVGKNPKAIIDCWAPWCGPCKMIAPIIDQLAKQYKGRIAFGKLNVDDNEVVTRKYNIMSIPVLLLLRNGELVDQIVGAVPKTHIIDKINESFNS